MSRSIAEHAVRREIVSAGPAGSGSSGRPDNAGSSVFGGLRGFPAAATSLLCRIFDILIDWQERARQRHMLMGLDDHMLRDIGLTRADAEAEYRKPPWRL